ncbi:helix-turn-helix domain-containing protein [Singulisphaera sp. Ch08]|uniref:helix-turn-helix domain-containing protein n=1 Tax=Singulisphaera sp. Ch08 TaxID=3120278 RepID=UPI003872DA9C
MPRQLVSRREPLSACKAGRSVRLPASFKVEPERCGLSLTDLQAKTGIDRATLSKIENGKVPNPTYSTLAAFARALGCPAECGVYANPIGPGPDRASSEIAVTPLRSSHRTQGRRSCRFSQATSCS